MADEIKKDSVEASADTQADNTAEKKPEKKAEKKSDKSNTPKKKEGNVFSRAWKAIKKFFKDVRGECKKVVWPDAKTVIKSTGVVLLCVAVLGLIIWLIDTGLSEVVKLIINAAKNASESGDAETTTEAVAAVAGMIHGFLGF